MGKGKGVKEFKSAFEEVRLPTSEKSESAEAAPVDIRWIDDDSAFAILPETCRGAVVELLARHKTANADTVGPTLTAWEEWLLAQDAEISEPEAKRARTGA